MFKRTVDIEEVRNGELILGSALWLARYDGWVFGVGLMPHGDAPRLPAWCSWGCLCICPQGEKHFIPDDNDSFRALRDSMPPGVLLSGLVTVAQFMDGLNRGEGIRYAENFEGCDLLQWLDGQISWMRQELV